MKSLNVTKQEAALVEAFRKNPPSVRAMLLNQVQLSAQHYERELEATIERMEKIKGARA